MKKIMILGADGMAGHAISDYLKSIDKYNIFTVGRTNSNDIVIKDIETDLEELDFMIHIHQPDIIINCIGMLVKACSDNPAKAIFINGYFPHWLSKQKAKIIHLSTDCVFSGNKGDYKDTDEKDGKGQYAEVKSIGEIVNDKDLTIRMSIIGKELKKNGSGLFDWFLRQKGTITGYDKAYWTGITTSELAKAIDKLIEANFTGLYQLAFPYKISKYELIQLIAKIWKKFDVKIERDVSNTHDKSLVNTSKSIPDYKLPMSYKVMLEEYYAYNKLRYQR